MITEVLVVGAGVAGRVAALALHRAGIDVVLAGPPEPGPDHDVLLGGSACAGLRGLGVHLPASQTALDLVIGDGPVKRLHDTELVVVSRAALLAALPAPQPLPHLVTGVARTAEGFLAALSDGSTVRAAHVIHTPGTGPADGTVLVQRFRPARPVRRVRQTLLPPSGPQAEPVCGWELPGPDGTATVGVLRMGAEHAEPVLPDGEPLGPPVSGPLYTGFAPDHCVRDGRLMAGDAAGLANPFTGEGLSHAVQSALLAAAAVAGHRTDPARAARAYRTRMSTSYVGYFETARHARRRYHLMWRVLEAGADSDHPFFSKTRRAMLTSDGLAAITTRERLESPGGTPPALAAFLLATDEVAIAAIRRDWPFLARLLVSGDPGTDRRPRPALLFHGALLAAGTPPPITRATTAAALELALLGTLAFLGRTGPEHGPEHGPARGVDWARAATVLAGDGLLAEASRLVAESAPEASWSFGDWLAELTGLRAEQLVTGGTAEPVFEALLEYPARIGAELGGAAPATVDALSAFGRHCGRALLHAEEVLAGRGERTRLDTTAAVLADSALTGRAEDPAAACRAAHRAALDVLPAGPGEPLLRAFADVIAAPARQDEPARQ